MNSLKGFFFEKKAFKFAEIFLMELKFMELKYYEKFSKLFHGT